MTYKLEFNKSALKEWSKLEATTKAQFKKKLAERLEHPEVPASRLRMSDNAYKIKLRNSGYRLVYTVDNDRIVVTVVAVGKRNRNVVYKAAKTRLKNT
ncbi:type II toxin-antitoxin system RelE family toxin [Aestuariispira ectoiniformans]|uniref:type II toxin-antitoxin system RelE family toxin n=1 Tax=Aestuariispira ectoiniformans TaxID=2775080 RepID=UPI00223BEF3B|nr:type II toxin-antitoxin system RelE/ParE family toxin [Aestuariispira ectoiniformans]